MFQKLACFFHLVPLRLLDGDGGCATHARPARTRCKCRKTIHKTNATNQKKDWTRIVAAPSMRRVPAEWAKETTMTTRQSVLAGLCTCALAVFAHARSHPTAPISPIRKSGIPAE
ncbi:hypothetical protein [Pseudorhodoferax sp.]|uniref:hypothetical protein n=1 Tax=Pseudorhodoferax sp. TaxID=1993553 RepID=UPI002DD68F44|nr:hypothetical protein [Pseudorhodoferax sp.]